MDLIVFLIVPCKAKILGIFSNSLQNYSLTLSLALGMISSIGFFMPKKRPQTKINMSHQDELQAQAISPREPPKTAVADNIKESFLVLIVSVLSVSCVVVFVFCFFHCACALFYHQGSHTFILVCTNYQCHFGNTPLPLKYLWYLLIAPLKPNPWIAKKKKTFQ